MSESKKPAAVAAMGLFLYAALPASPALGTESTLTKFTPDVVIECKGNPGETPICALNCFNMSTSSASQPNPNVPTILFQRLEFFSKPGRESENWLVAVSGRIESPAIPNNSTFFMTIGRSHTCVYNARERPSGGKPYVIELTKYY